MGQDCLWDREEQDCEWTAQLICSSIGYGTRLPLGQRGAKQRIDSLAQLFGSSLCLRQCSHAKRGYTEFMKIIENQEKPRKTKETQVKSRKTKKKLEKQQEQL